MTKLWWAQVKAVIRLEMKKTFLARRGLWIYVLALLPVLLFIAHAVIVSHEQAQSRDLASRSERPLSYQDLNSVKPGMTRDEVVTLLGKPPARFHWNQRKPILQATAVLGTGGMGTPVNLSAAYNRNGIYTDGEHFDNDGLDGTGYAISSVLLGQNRILDGVQFNFGPPNQPNAAYGDSNGNDNDRAINLPASQFAKLQLLATGVDGPVLNQNITVLIPTVRPTRSRRISATGAVAARIPASNPASLSQ